MSEDCLNKNLFMAKKNKSKKYTLLDLTGKLLRLHALSFTTTTNQYFYFLGHSLLWIAINKSDDLLNNILNNNN